MWAEGSTSLEWYNLVTFFFRLRPGYGNTQSVRDGKVNPNEGHSVATVLIIFGAHVNIFIPYRSEDFSCSK